MAALMFVLYATVEIAAFGAVGWWIGVLPTILVLLAASAVGMLMVAAQGRRVLEQLRRAGRGQVGPDVVVADGVMVAGGAVLLFVPGLVTSLCGLLLLVPPVRLLLRPVLTAVAARRFAEATARAPYGGVIIDADSVIDGDRGIGAETR
ncbi:FxsA family protein [Nocardia sp. CNY236]|uniref:FxsA family protein n=1 Tax=Nocardia sp. CNY236 TaxID=1169152 RepID=UPI00041CE2A8|nr:FxsA family protein [Nocardia sp. CNY236]